MNKSRSASLVAATLLFGAMFSGTVLAQQIAVSTPFTNVSDSFYENHGVNFGFSLPGGQGPGSRVVGFNGFNQTPNINFFQGSAGSAIPAFGGFDPNAAARFGFSNRGSNGGGFNLGFTLGKGNTRTLTSTTPTITVQNGQGGTLIDGQLNPFVTGVTPVVGFGGGTPISPIDNAVTRAIASGQLDLTRPTSAPETGTRRAPIAPQPSKAQTGDMSVAAIKARRAAEIAEKEARIKALVKKSEELESAGEIYEAKKAIRQAIRECKDDSVKRQLRSRLKQISGK